MMDSNTRQSFNERRKTGEPLTWEDCNRAYNIETISENRYMPGDEAYFKGLQEGFILSMVDEKQAESLREKHNGSRKTEKYSFMKEYVSEGKLDSLYVQDQRNGRGNGVYTKELISKGANVGKYVGLIRRLKSGESLGHFSLFLNLSLGLVIDATNEGNITRFIQDSPKEYNCIVVSRLGKNLDIDLWIVASRDINIGEELLLNHDEGTAALEMEKVDAFDQACGGTNSLHDIPSEVSMFNDYVSGEDIQCETRVVLFDPTTNSFTYKPSPASQVEDNF